MNFKRILNLALVMIIAVSLLNCASQSLHPYPDDVDVKAEIQTMDGQLKMAQQGQLDVFAPISFRNAIRSLEDARKAQEKGKTRKTILLSLGDAREYTDRVYRRGERIKRSMHPVFDARANAIAAGAMYLAKDVLAETDLDLKDYTEGLATDHESQLRERDIARLQEMYLGLELDTIKRDKLGAAHHFVRQATDFGAKEIAPDLLVKTEAKIFAAEKALDSDRHGENNYGPAVRAATDEARDLLKTTLLASKTKKMTAQEVTQNIKAQDELMAKASAETQAQRKQALLQSNYIQSITEANQQLAGDVSFATKLREIETRFKKSEVEVYRQGDNVVLRLKAIKFGKSRSEIPAASIPTLAKVNDVIKELGAEKVTVEEHTDFSGNKKKNIELSQKRAEAVSKYFVSRASVSAEQVVALGLGHGSPLSGDGSSGVQVQNRRVDVIIQPPKRL